MAKARKQKRKAANCEKPYPTYPLFGHKSGQWAKKFRINNRQRTVYFGVHSDPDAAHALYLKEKPDWEAGRIPDRNSGDAETVLKLINRFLTSKLREMEADGITKRHYNDLLRSCEQVRDKFGRETHIASLRPEDFGLLRADYMKTLGTVALKNSITRVREIFNFAAKNLNIHVQYGSEFDKPTALQRRIEKLKKPKKFFEPKEIRKILGAANPQLKAMVLLGINAGYLNSDVARLTTAHLNLRTGWADYARTKTGIDRRCWLWRETVQAVKEALRHRVEPKDPAHKDHIFITRLGTRWLPKSRTETDSPISELMGNLLGELNLKQKGRSFSALRTTCSTIARETKDLDAVNKILGHVPQGIGAIHYNEKPPSDARLKAVAQHIHDWLFPKSKSVARRRRG